MVSAAAVVRCSTPRVRARRNALNRSHALSTARLKAAAAPRLIDAHAARETSVHGTCALPFGATVASEIDAQSGTLLVADARGQVWCVDGANSAARALLLPLPPSDEQVSALAIVPEVQLLVVARGPRISVHGTSDDTLPVVFRHTMPADVTAIAHIAGLEVFAAALLSAPTNNFVWPATVIVMRI